MHLQRSDIFFRQCFAVARQFCQSDAYLFALGYDIACQKQPSMLPVARYGIIVYLALQFLDNLTLGFVGGSREVVHIDTPVVVERSCQRFGQGQYKGRIYPLERNGFSHYVGFCSFAVGQNLYGVNLHSRSIERNYSRLVAVVEIAPTLDKGIIQTVKFFPSKIK